MNSLRTLFVLLALTGAAGGQTTWYVDIANCPGGSGTQLDPYCQIQDAINAAVDGDTVLVLPGTYFENIDLADKAITVQSTSGAAVTILDGSMAGPVVTTSSLLGPGTVLDGFTVRNGQSASLGGGLTLYGAPTVRNNIVENNTGGKVGGILCGGAGLIENNIVRNNHSVNGVGGLECTYNITIQGNLIEGNTSDSYVGGVYISQGGRLLNNVVQDNTTNSGKAAGILMHQNCQVHDNTILRNLHSSAQAGGIYATAGGGSILRNTISGNHGGIVVSSAANLTIANNFLANNTTAGNGVGGGVTVSFATVAMRNNTYFNNSGTGAGALFILDGDVSVSNSIFWKSASPPNVEIQVIAFDGADLTIDHSTVFGGMAGVSVLGGTLNWGAAMIDDDPRFVDELNGDLHLDRFSPCINRGSNLTAEVDDRDGDPRPVQGTPDMGADEFVGVHPLQGSAFSLLEVTGGPVQLDLDLGAAAGLRRYLVLGGFTGTVPGLPLNGSVKLPLSWDLLTPWLLSLSVKGHPTTAGFLGTLDGAGRASATFDTLGPLPLGSAGTTLNFAGATVAPWDVATNPILVEIQ